MVGATSEPRRTKRRWQRPGRFLRDLNLSALVVVLAAGGAFLMVPAGDDGLLGLPDLAEGDVSPRTIKSPQAFVINDAETTDRIRRERVANLRPVYDLLAGLGPATKERLEGAFEAAREPRDAIGETITDRDRALAFMLHLDVTIDEELLLPLIKKAGEDELRDAALMIVQRLYEQRIVDDKALLLLKATRGIELRLLNREGKVAGEETFTALSTTLGFAEARARVDELVAAELKRLTAEQRRGVATVVKRLLRPNLIPNELETRQRREFAEASVKPVSNAIRPGEVVLRAGERVTRQHLTILKGIDQELRARDRVEGSIGSAILVILLVVLGYRYASRSFLPGKPGFRDLTLLTVTYLMTLLLFWIGYKGAAYLVEVQPEIGPLAARTALPVAAGVLLVRVTTEMEAALAFTVLTGVTAGWVFDVNLEFAIYALVGGLAAGSVPSTAEPRPMFLRAALRIGLAQATVIVALGLLTSGTAWEDHARGVGAALVSGLLATVLAFLAVPVVEVLFGHTTTMKLTDLANLNHPLLRDLVVEAPGTYHHSIMVGTLAEEAAQEVRANPLLARVGGYYHDIGKMKNPRVFDENERGAFVGPPTTEAAELRRHVQDGLELGLKHRLGNELLEIIAQHHGTSAVRAARRRQLELQGVAEPADFAYDGPRPLTSEAALVMLADVVECATRELANQGGLSRAMLESAVRKAVNEVLEDGQLDACPLTLRDLGLVVESFTRTLEERLIKKGRPPTLSSFPVFGASSVVRAPRGEPN